MDLSDGEPKLVRAGYYAVKVRVTSGTVNLQYDFGEGDGMDDIEGTSFSANADIELPLANCNVKAVITDVGSVYMKLIEGVAKYGGYS